MSGRRGARAAAIVAVTAVVVLTGCRGPVSDEPLATTAPSATATQARPAPAPAAAPITLAFAGDVHFEGSVAALLDDPDATLGPLSAALSSADVAVVNLESAMTSTGTRAAKELESADRRFWFRTPTSALDVFERSGVDVVTMANNHGADYGAAGLRDSLRAAEASPVGVIGIGANPAQAYQPYVTSVNGTDVAVLAADAAKLESRDPIWNVGASGPGIARADARLVAAVRQAAADNDVVAVYLHWGEEGAGCPNDDQRSLAASLSAAGADVIVGSHSHQLQGAGLLGSTYVSYGLGNFVWYHGREAATGVLQVQVAGGAVVGETFVPGVIPPQGGVPTAPSGARRTAAVEAWQALRGCTGLAAGPGAAATQDEAPPGSPSASAPAFVSSIQPVPSELRRRMAGSSHDGARCPVPLADLRLLTLGYIDFAGAAQVGQLIVHEDHARDVVEVFGRLYAARFPIERMRLVDDYGGDDNASMAANNTSAYNCRTVAGQSSFSQHAYGAAVDINPVQNPYLTGGEVLPEAGRRYAEIDRSSGTRADPGVIVDGDVVVQAFAAVGWQWGGRWSDPDYQHFDAR